MRTHLEPSEYVGLSDLQRREFSGYSAILNQWAIARLASLTYMPVAISSSRQMVIHITQYTNNKLLEMCKAQRWEILVLLGKASKSVDAASKLHKQRT